jgi:ribosomal protein S18 acetylase RimI-like enzyme
LLDAAETALVDRGADVLAIEAMADNDGARRLYRRRGYDPHRVQFERPVEADESAGTTETDTSETG